MKVKGETSVSGLLRQVAASKDRTIGFQDTITRPIVSKIQNSTFRGFPNSINGILSPRVSHPESVRRH